MKRTLMLTGDLNLMKVTDPTAPFAPVVDRRKLDVREMEVPGAGGHLAPASSDGRAKATTRRRTSSSR